ncbi:serine/threonine protein kinase [Stieleria varia]|nr:serine/threonine-protein kinase [Stieleria varia]
MKRKCLDERELQLVLSGDMPAAQFDSAIAHLDSCPQCRDTVSELQSHATVTLQPIAEPEIDPLQSETACQVALCKLLESPRPTAKPHDATFIPCKTLGPYELVAPLGQGGMGTVYLALHQRLKRKCAIKLLPRERVDQPGWLDRFDREMRSVASLEHPHVVRATDAGHESGWHYLVMEHLDGLDVSQVAGRMDQLSVADACEIVRQAALGLAHIHDAGLVHRDIKPSNLMLTQNGTVKLLDLGLVLPGDDPLSVDDRLTTVGHVMGTMPYMAPEQLSDSRLVNPLSDIYSLGATLYRLIAGRPPHGRQRGLAAQVLAITSADPASLDSIREDVDREVVTLVDQMLNRDPAKRPQSAAEIAKRLEHIGKSSRLKHLIRQAVRRADRDATEPATLMRSMTSASSARSDNRWKGLLVGAMGMAAILFAALVIKIQTDRGELVVHSEQDNLTILVKQGTEVVERLRVDQPGDHRSVLSKGTYRVEIEGGGDALVLSDNVVTIGRSTSTSLNVLPAEKGKPQPVSMPEPKPAVDDDPMLAMEGMKPDPINPIDDLIRQIETESDLDALGKAMLNAVNLVTPEQPLSQPELGGIGGGMGGGMLPSTLAEAETRKENTERIATSILKRARDFGGLHVKIPPPPNSDAYSITPSEHFMWYLTECLPRLSMMETGQAAKDELLNGNGKSRAAILHCWYSQGMVRPETRSSLSEWIRACSVLISDDEQNLSWDPLPAEDRETAASYAYYFILNHADTYGLNPLTIPTFADALQAKNKSELSKQELGLLAEIGALDANAAMPMDDISEMEHEPTQQSNDTPGASKVAADTQAIFKGRDMDQWMTLLQREQEANALGEVMEAVEVLTRGSDRRTDAARDTLKLTRRLGGMTSSGTGRGFGSSDADPSSRFMGFFLEVYPHYLPDPGFDLLANELNEGVGNHKSHMAIIYLLMSWPELEKHLVTAVQSDDDPTRQQVMELINNLARIGSELQSLPKSESTLGDFSGAQAYLIAMKINHALGRSINEQPALRDFAQQKLASTLERWKKTGNTSPGAMSNYWDDFLVDETCLSVAIELGQSDDLEPAVWKLYAEKLLQRNVSSSEHVQQDFETIAAAIPENVNEVIEAQLKKLIVDHSVSPNNGGQFTIIPPPLYDQYPNTPWRSALLYYAKHATDPGDALEILENLKTKLTERPMPFQGKRIAEYDQALEILTDRVK